MTSPISVTRLEMETTWLSKVQAAQRRYRVASAKYRRALEEHKQFSLPSPDGVFALRQAAQAEAAALHQYTRTLKVFTDLIVDAKLPPSESNK